MRTDIFERRSEIEIWVSQLRSKASICRELKCKPLTLDSYLKKLGLAYKAMWAGKVLSNRRLENQPSNFFIKEAR
jgi:hypothetical protein